MTEIEKTLFAVWLSKRLLLCEKKILAIAAIRKLYNNCSIQQAKEFVEYLERCEQKEFLEKLFNFTKGEQNES